MGLSHLKLRTATVEVSDGESFTVRGLGVEDIIPLVEAHKAELAGLFQSHLGGKKGGVPLALSDTSTLVATLFKVAPTAAHQIIALAADEPDTTLAKLLPFPVQLDALEKIGRLTFASAGGPKKVVETVIRVMGGTTEALASLSA